MGAVQTIEKVIAASRAKRLDLGAVLVSLRGATDAELAELERGVARPLAPAHAELLRRWNGLDLAVLRIHGAGTPEPGIRPIGWEGRTLVLASDPSGFVYVESPGGAIIQIDTDGGDHTRVANDFDDFLCGYVFGAQSAKFMGDAWRAELIAAGLGSA
jgi:hypothetical protein